MDWGSFAGGVAQTALPTYLKLQQEKREQEDQKRRRDEQKRQDDERAAAAAAMKEVAGITGDMRGYNPAGEVVGYGVGIGAQPNPATGLPQAAPATPAVPAVPNAAAVPTAGAALPGAAAPAAIPPSPPVPAPDTELEEVVVNGSRQAPAEPAGAIPPVEKPARYSSGKRSDYYYSVAEAFLKNGEKNPALFQQAMLYKERGDAERAREVSTSINGIAATKGFAGLADYFDTVSDGNTFDYEQIKDGKDAGRYRVTYGDGNSTVVDNAPQLASQLIASISGDPKLIADMYDRNATRETQRLTQETQARYYQIAGDNEMARQRLEARKLSLLERQDARAAKAWQEEYDIRTNYSSVVKSDPLLNGPEQLQAAAALASIDPRYYKTDQTVDPETGQIVTHSTNVAVAAIQDKMQEQQARLEALAYPEFDPSGAPVLDPATGTQRKSYPIFVSAARDESGNVVRAFRVENDPNVYTSLDAAERAYRKQKKAALPAK